MIWGKHEFLPAEGNPTACRVCPFGKEEPPHVSRVEAKTVARAEDAGLATLMSFIAGLGSVVNELREAREALGEAWLYDGATLAEGIRRKTEKLESLLDGERIEKCEACDSAAVARHDVEGVPLCIECWGELCAENAPDEKEDTE